MLTAKIKLYDVSKCGYFCKNSSQMEFGGIKQTLDKIGEWASEKEYMAHTATYEVNNDKDGDQLNTYFCDYKKNDLTGDSVLTLWNETPHNKGIVYGINANQSLGDLSLVSTDLGNIIPGVPSYFLFIPDHEVYAAVIINRSLYGKKNLRSYIYGYLSNKASEYMVKGSEGEIIGYSNKGVVESPLLYPRFNTSLRKNKSLRDELITKCDQIRKIIKIEKFNYMLPDDRSRAQKVLDFVLNKESDSHTDDLKIEFIMDYQPTKQELITLIDDYYSDDRDHAVKNVGFVLQGNQNRIMLSGTHPTFDLELNIDANDGELVPAKKILEAISSNRNKLIQELSLTSEGD